MMPPQETLVRPISVPNATGAVIIPGLELISSGQR